MGRDDELVAMLQAADDPGQLSAELPATTLRRLARSYGLFETVGGRAFNGPENAARIALAERLRRAGLPHRQHAGRPVPLQGDAATAFRAELLHQAELVRVAAPEELRPALADDGELGEVDRAQLLSDVRALLASPRGAAIVAQARTLAGVLIALLG